MEGVAVGGSSGSAQWQSDGGIWVSIIGDRQLSGEQNILWRDDTGAVCWDGYGEHPGGRMILFRGKMGGVRGQGRKRTLPLR